MSNLGQIITELQTMASAKLSKADRTALIVIAEALQEMVRLMTQKEIRLDGRIDALTEEVQAIKADVTGLKADVTCLKQKAGKKPAKKK